ncbi:MAG: hypothetical protein IPO76_09825 [Elusimicrobia bacterium]|jgi:hypothetical protein|nr:hypothetical protein [Elusimicrobiota bacterium]MBK7207225.1 hypothetical protein [Elusimicrobiota bacterium]MBK7546030.1 hypothetical protein [Elusimicrobiota bacterium]MBK7574906.1 hypothetical protein [Elusimicrobiota bacterium]MBK7687443.1 hypothetical protein [Elusimicrobiota bacterium]
MNCYLYCMAYPIEALVASMLPPEEFGSYMAIGSKKSSRGKVVFMEIDKDHKAEGLDMERARRECRPHADGRPKSSVYLSIYRVLEHLPLESVKQLYLTTKDGRTLAIAPQQVPTEASHLRRGGVFLYQELAPARPQVVSGLDPLDFGRLMTDPKNPIRLPKLLFARMRVGAEAGSIAAQSDLPYGNLPHLQNCAQEVLSKNKTTKTVERSQDDFFYSAIMDGLYLASPSASLYFPFPTEAELKDKYYQWWRSAV